MQRRYNRPTTKKGWYTSGDRKYYLKSSWELKYAQFLDKELSNGKMDKEAIKHTIKTKYLNSYKVIVAGGRDFDNYEFLKEKLDETFESLGDLDAHPIEIISGMANGADTLGIKYAKEHKLTRVLYPANWDKYPRMAGILRNLNICLLRQHIL